MLILLKKAIIPIGRDLGRSPVQSSAPNGVHTEFRQGHMGFKTGQVSKISKNAKFTTAPEPTGNVELS